MSSSIRTSVNLEVLHNICDLTARKAKHLSKFRGPARITKVLTPTTFELRYKSHTDNHHCLSQLRRYRTTGEPLLDVGVVTDGVKSF